MATSLTIDPMQARDASRLDSDLAWVSLKKGDRETAWKLLWQSADRLSGFKNKECESQFVTTCIELSDLGFSLGRRFDDLLLFLQKAQTMADQLGDRRSHAVINLHLGRVYNYAEQHQKAMEALAHGIKEVEQLGDDDILTQAHEFFGLYYFIQGLFNEAKVFFKRATESFETSDKKKLLNPSGPVYLSYCEAFLGQFHSAIGTLDYYRRMAIEMSDHGLATNLRARLGIILAMINRTKEASYHLSGALHEATKTENVLAKYAAKGGISYLHYKEGRLNEARDWLADALLEGTSAGIIRSYYSPVLLEMLFEFDQRNIKPISQISFQRELRRIMLGPNLYMRGVACRLKAKELLAHKAEDAIIESELTTSEDYLQKSGDPVQLAKTLLEWARLMLRRGDQEKACVFAQKSWKGFSGYGDVFYPDNLRHLLMAKGPVQLEKNTHDELLNNFLSMIEELVPTTDFDHLLSRVVSSTNRFFGAERGGIFWFRYKQIQKRPELRAAHNLLEADVNHDEFANNMEFVIKAFQSKIPQVVRRDEKNLEPNQVKAALALPFTVSGRTRGVLYHDNSYVKDCFDQFDELQLNRITQSLSSYVEKVMEFGRKLKKQRTYNINQLGGIDSPEIITQSDVMKKLLDQIDQIAATDSTVLISGETGVGKELVARRIHQQSPRQGNPLVVVDPTTIPEHLFESELFGHEKGAFTGADRQKSGRLELSHRGTLFIDEVSEIPPVIQVKFLRVLQEKTMTRVGGTKTIYSDFRLIAATNRNLAEEVAKGRFREDLYYRLNVIPVMLPALRDRVEDIEMLASHFMYRYIHKYNRTELKLAPKNVAQLTSYRWPGNVRELQNVMERAVLLSSGNELVFHFPEDQQERKTNPFDDMPTLAEVQRRYIKYVLEKTNGKLSGPESASEILDMKRTSLYNRMIKLGLR